MSNYNREIVLPDDGRRETRYFIIMMLSVVAVAGTALQFVRHQEKPPASELPRRLLSYATQLSNYTEELNMLEENQLLRSPYSTGTMSLPALGEDSFTQMENTCFALWHDGVLFSVYKPQSRWQAHWAFTHQLQHCSASIQWHPLNR